MTRRPIPAASRRARAARLLGGGLAAACFATSGSGAPSADPAIRFHASVTVDGPIVTLGDAADLAALPPALRQRAQALVLIALAPSAKTAQVDEQRLSDAARHGIPMLAPWLADTPPRRIEIVRRIAGPRMAALDAAPSPAACVTLRVDLPRSASPSAEQLRSTGCPRDGLQAAWRYDAATQVARAARDLKAGEIVVPPAPSRLAVVHRGERVLDTVQVGAVTVTRSGTALTDAGSHRAAAVLTGDAAIQLWRAPAEDRGS
ncbi:hypothetical protein [Burkholderia gladioli]|uniref:hypothetical protein n=1 Tax=Burkholderia gladioli TaxID=28095 RepID=UPI00164137E6|nr:hypothetical protein [Burkholderia gladioli]